jgi:diguanylate cyclase (GGDEF)-like protein
MLRRSLRNFLTLVVLPLLLAGGGTIWLTADLVSRLSTGANGEDHKRTAEVVESALQASRQQLANVLADNANWDDAAANIYSDRIDPAFVVSAWGDPSVTGINYDALMVVDAAATNLIAYERGEPTTADATAYFGGRLQRLLAQLPQNSTEFQSAAVVIETEKGPALVAAANVVPTSDDLIPATVSPRFLVFWKFLTADYVAGLGDKFVVNGLAFLPRDQAAGGDYVVTNAAGDTLGAMHWQDRRPGDLALTNVLPKAYLMLMLLIGVMAAIALMSWRLFRQLSDREERARRDAHEDALTRLPNRAALMAGLGQLLGLPEPVTATFVDLDGFKDINDTYDHETGDRLIMAVAAGLGALAPEARLISRIGGDEFVIVHAGADAVDSARTAASRVIAFLGDPIDIGGRLARVGASIGIALSDDRQANAGELMRRADVAMYAAKAAGKNRYCLFDAAMDQDRDQTAAIVGELRRILDAGLIETAYQPIIDAATLAVTGVEALARWPHSSPLRIGPDRFIPVAETSGLIDRLGECVLEKACRDAAGWRDLRISVNVSPVQLRNPHFAARTLAVIDRCGIDRRRVEIEVTEGTMIDDIRRLQPIFETLHKAGVSVALDDFGSGYSSIAYLRELHFDRIKIDRSLTRAILSSDAARNMIQATGLIAAGLKAQVTAEGVETGEEVQLLRLAGCTEYQGYFFGKPQPAAAITAALSDQAAAA